MKRLFEQFKSLSIKAKFLAILVALFLIGSLVIAFFGGNEDVHVSPTHRRAKTNTPHNKLIVMNPEAMDGKPDGIIASESIDSKKDNNEDGIQPIDEEDEGDLSKLIKTHMRNNTIMIVSMNGGFLSHAANLLCSLSRFNLTKYVLFWALDKTALLALKRYKEKTKSHGVVMDFGIYYNASKKEYPADALRPGSWPYMQMMGGRPEFFVKILKEYKVGLLFVDADVVFLKDPWDEIVGNGGLGGKVDTSVMGYFGNENDEAFFVEPDIVYSADPRKSYYELEDPFEGGWRVPKVCGGLFYAKPNTRSIRVYEKLYDEVVFKGGNDQHSVNYIFNHIFDDVLLVGPLPVCVPRIKGEQRFCPDLVNSNETAILEELKLPKNTTTVKRNITENTILVRMIDQAEFIPALAYKNKFPRRAHKYLGMTGYAFHPNFWDRNKKDAMKKLGLWITDDEDLCIADIPLDMHDLFVMLRLKHNDIINRPSSSLFIQPQFKRLQHNDGSDPNSKGKGKLTMPSLIDALSQKAALKNIPNYTSSNSSISSLYRGVSSVNANANSPFSNQTNRYTNNLQQNQNNSSYTNPNAVNNRPSSNYGANYRPAVNQFGGNSRYGTNNGTGIFQNSTNNYNTTNRSSSSSSFNNAQPTRPFPVGNIPQNFNGSPSSTDSRSRFSGNPFPPRNPSPLNSFNNNTGFQNYNRSNNSYGFPNKFDGNANGRPPFERNDKNSFNTNTSFGNGRSKIIGRTSKPFGNGFGVNQDNKFSQNLGRDSSHRQLGRHDTVDTQITPRIEEEDLDEGDEFVERKISKKKLGKLPQSSTPIDKYAKHKVAGPIRDLRSVTDFDDRRRKSVKKSKRLEYIKKGDIEKEVVKPPAEKKKALVIPDGITCANLGVLLGVGYDQLARTMKRQGFESNDPGHILTSENALLLAMEYNIDAVSGKVEGMDAFPRPTPEDWSIYPKRPPIVTIMGHVDHGKTTLLDTLRESSIVDGESGGITQHIGAFSVKLPSLGTITFLDTPGHSAFEQMRGRGAEVTDIVILVVAADDGVMPQTVEAIKHAHAANVPMIVAINKCDKPDINIDKIKEGLLQYDVVVEDLGGEVQAVPISALKGTGIQELEEAILTLAELSDLRGDDKGLVEGDIIESRLDKQMGNFATILVKRGTLTTGSILISGTHWCKVKQMLDEHNQHITEAKPSTPVKVIGWKTLPAAGDLVLQVDNENIAKKCIETRKLKLEREKLIESISSQNDARDKHAEIRSNVFEKMRQHQSHIRSHKLRRKKQSLYLDGALEDEAAREGEIPVLSLILKADVHGSLEAVESSIQGIPQHEVMIKIVHSGVGDITESDYDLASATSSHIFGFNVQEEQQSKKAVILQPPPSQKADDNPSSPLAVHHHKVIYNLLDEVKRLSSEKLPVEWVESVEGEADILALYEFNVKVDGKKKSAKTAGCRITSGKIVKSGTTIRVLRGEEVIYEGKLKSLKHIKKDIHEAAKGTECGMMFEDGFVDFKENDKVVSVINFKKERKIQ